MKNTPTYIATFKLRVWVSNSVHRHSINMFWSAAEGGSDGLPRDARVSVEMVTQILLYMSHILFKFYV